MAPNHNPGPHADQQIAYDLMAPDQGRPQWSSGASRRAKRGFDRSKPSASPATWSRSTAAHPIKETDSRPQFWALRLEEETGKKKKNQPPHYPASVNSFRPHVRPRNHVFVIRRQPGPLPTPDTSAGAPGGDPEIPERPPLRFWQLDRLGTPMQQHVFTPPQN